MCFSCLTFVQLQPHEAAMFTSTPTCGLSTCSAKGLDSPSEHENQTYGDTCEQGCLEPNRLQNGMGAFNHRHISPMCCNSFWRNSMNGGLSFTSRPGSYSKIFCTREPTARNIVRARGFAHATPDAACRHAIEPRHLKQHRVGRHRQDTMSLCQALSVPFGKCLHTFSLCFHRTSSSYGL